MSLHKKGNWGLPKNPEHLEIARKALSMQYSVKRTKNSILAGGYDHQYEIQAILYALAEQSQ